MLRDFPPGPIWSSLAYVSSPDLRSFFAPLATMSVLSPPMTIIVDSCISTNELYQVRIQRGFLYFPTLLLRIYRRFQTMQLYYYISLLQIITYNKYNSYKES